jgi:hypothetical protein
MDPLWPAIHNAASSVFRFEGLQDYSAEDSEQAVEHFITTGQLRSVPDDTNDWWRNIKVRRQGGLQTARVRLVLEPVTNYTKMELAYLRLARDYSGEDIRLISELGLRKIALGGLPDFYLIDDQMVYVMQYGPKGKYLGSREEYAVDLYIKIKEQLLVLSEPL